jgi:hypothetical protein
MFVRFRQRRNLLLVSLVETRRVDGKVRQEHIAGLGSIEVPPSVADRITFWQRLHERFAKLSNRVATATQTKVLGKIHARVPMVTADEQRALQLENAEADQQLWERLRDLHQSTANDHKGLAAKAERTAANGQAAAEAAAANAAGAKDRVDRIKGGENVPGGLGKPMTGGDWIKQLGLTRRDLRRMEHLMAVDKLGDDAWEEYSHEHFRELMKADNRMTLAAAREVLRRRFPEAPEDKQAAAREAFLAFHDDEAADEG